MKSKYRKPVAMFLVVMMLFTIMPAGAAFANGEEATEISLCAMVVEDTTAEELEKGDVLSEDALAKAGIEMPTLTDFSQAVTLSSDTTGIPATISVDDAIYEFAGFLHYEYDEATETGIYSLKDTYTIAAEPEKGTTQWEAWYTPISDGIYAAYKKHTHSYGEYTFDDGAGHFKLCTDSACPDENKGKTAIKEHTGNIDTVEGCSECRYSSVPLCITVSPSYLIGNGTITVTTNKYAHNIDSGSGTWSRSETDSNIWISNTIGGNGHFVITATAGTESTKSERIHFASAFNLAADKTALSGGGTITLVTSVPAQSITCDDESITIEPQGDENDWWKVTLPNKTATYTFTATLDNYVATCTVEVKHHWAGSELEITGSMPAATVGSAYSTSFGYTGEVEGVVFWNATGLPDGLTIDKSTGVVSGTPVKAGTYNVTIAMGATGGGSAAEDYTLTVKKRSSSSSSSQTQIESKDILEYVDTANPLNPGKVVFEPDDDTDLPKDAELVVKPYKPGPLDWRMLLDIGVTEYVTLDKDSIHVNDPVSLTHDGVTYSLYDIIRIDGVDYLLTAVGIGIDGWGNKLLRLSDGVEVVLDAPNGKLLNPKAEGWPCEVPANKVVIINDVAYNVMCIYNASGLGDDYYERWILYYNGEPAGCYFPNKGWADFYGAYDPASVKGQKGDEFLGTVFIPEKDPGSKTREDLLADQEAAKKAYDDCLKSPRLTLRELDRLQRALLEAQDALQKYDANAQLRLGKTYEVYTVGAQDILVEGADDVSGTVTQTFGIPAQFVGSSKVKYVAVHVTSDAETDSQFGTVTVSKDRKELEAVYHVSSFSPFVVYALVEQPDRIVMQINNTNIVVNNKTITNDVPPVIVDDRTLVPVRIVTELLGGSADWNADTRTVTLTIDGKVLNLVIGEEIPGYGTGAAIMDNRTYVPIRYVAEQLGAEVEWIADTRQIVIEK